MFQPFKRGSVASATALALGSALIMVPSTATATPLNASGAIAVAFAGSQKNEVHGQIHLTDSLGNALAAGTEVKLLIGDPGQEVPFTVGENGLFEITKELAADETEEIKVAFADNPDGAVTLTLAGNQGDTISEATLKQLGENPTPETYVTTVKIKVTDADGKALAEGTKVSLAVGDAAAAEHEVDANGQVTISVEAAKGEEKTVTVALVDAKGKKGKAVAVTVTGGENTEPVVVKDALMLPKKDDGGKKPSEKGSSMPEGFDIGKLMDPNLWATVIGSLLTAQAFVFILQVVGDFINGLALRFLNKRIV